MNRAHAERGQVLPLWVVAILTTFALMFMAINYGNTVRWQMRAQNAADGAAQALMAIQTQRYNELTAALYASNVEEFRIRLLLDGMLNAADGAGGCTGPGSWVHNATNAFPTGTGTCDEVFNNLTTAYLRAVNRYTKDVSIVNDIATKSTYANWTSDVAAMRNHLSNANNCNDVTSTTVNASGGDCQFKYTIVGYKARTGLNQVAADAYTVFVPTQGFTLANNTETENAAYFQPGAIDIVTCAKVPPVIPGFDALSPKPHYVIGRAGATAVLTEEDWFQPGHLIDPVRGTQTQFQPQETYDSADAGLSYDWYGVNFGGNSWKVQGFTYNGQPKAGYVSQPVINDFSAYDGFWNAIPYDPRNVDNGSTISVQNDCN